MSLFLQLRRTQFDLTAFVINSLLCFEIHLFEFAFAVRPGELFWQLLSEKKSEKNLEKRFRI